MDVAEHRSQLSMACLEPLNQCIARGAYHGRRKGVASSLAVSSVWRGQLSADMLRAFVGEREAAVEIATRRPQLLMRCLKPVKQRIALS